MANDMDNSDTELGLLKGEAVSLLNSSSNKALEKQSRKILNFMTGLTEQLAKNYTANSTVHVTECRPAFEFKQKGTKFNWFQSRKDFKVSEIEGLLKKVIAVRRRLLLPRKRPLYNREITF